MAIMARMWNFVQTDTASELNTRLEQIGTFEKNKTRKYKYLALNINVSIFMQQRSDNLHMASSHCCD